MALISCPECGTGVSDKAGKCPQCGCPITEQTAASSQGVRTGIMINVPESMLPYGMKVKLFNAETNEELIAVSTGDTALLYISKPTKIKAKGFKGEEVIKPGMKYQMNAGGLFTAKMSFVELGKM